MLRFCLAAACVFSCSVASAAIELAKDGKTDFVIMIRPNASAVERNAARELADHLKQVTGADFPVSTKDTESPAILVANVPPNEMGPDSIILQGSGKELHLVGQGPLGALYAVYTFLEDQVGVRWWTNTESTIPHKPTLSIDDLDIRYTPKLRYRETFHWHVLDGNYQAAARMKLNGHFSKIPSDWGGHYDILGWCHTCCVLLPPAKYFGPHPEWYSFRGGKRNIDGGQMCWTNPEMQKEMAKQALIWIRKNPTAGIISISQNDQIGFCECDQCKAIEQANGGAHSASLISGINAIAAIIAKEYPDFLVETLAYQYTRQAPTQIKPAKNVLVRLCSIECDFSHPLSGPQNKGFGGDLRNWSKLADNLFIWNYVTNFSSYVIPHPNMTPIADDLRFFVDHKVVGVFEQADSANHLAGDMLPLRCWVQAHLLWDPSRDQDALTREFLNGYYGAAGPHLYDYVQVVNAPARNPAFRRGCYSTDVSFLTPDAMIQCVADFDAAEKAVADDPVLLARVRRERLELEHTQLLQWSFPTKFTAYAEDKHVSEDEAVAAVCKEYQAAATDFCNRATAAGVINYSEGQSFPSYKSALVERYQRFIPPKIPKPGEPLPAGAVDIQEDQFKLASPGFLATIMADPDASNGKTVRMPGNHIDWAVQYHVPKDSKAFGKGPWRCYFVIRAKLKDKSVGGFTYGLFDPATGGHVAMEGAGLDMCGDEKYHAYGMKIDELKPGMYFWVAPPGVDAVEGIYVDRIFIEKQDK